MSYTYPAGTAANLQFGGAYTRPAGNAANLSWATAAPDSVTGVGAFTLDLVPAGTGKHGVTGAGAFTIDLAPSGAGEHQAVTVQGTGAFTIELVPAGAGGHGVAGSGALTISLTPAGEAGHGVAGAGAIPSIDLVPAGSGAHGVAGTGAFTIDLVPSGHAIHQRYELRGEVRQGGILVNRRVRVYLRSTGALVGEVDTVEGQFAIHAGFASAEHYVVPIDLGDGATDWAPPVANRVESVLAED